MLDINQIKELLPHRYPFLLVDKIVEMEKGKRIVGIKNVTANEEFFNGHFPIKPIMPGVLMVEALAQTCGVLALQEESNKGKLALFAGLESVKFKRMVVPGDVLKLEVNITASRSRIVKAEGVASVDGEIAVIANMMFAIA
ncbi:MAG: 3-hydroxyacyl-ACP dehydratase FabZ [Candidatus Omnitrophica bacterium]|nr:3-hydroxyacyl-ACP dehydratase FabZ [Candidatus Omnitrophota bacterium]